MKDPLGSPGKSRPAASALPKEIAEKVRGVRWTGHLVPQATGEHGLYSHWALNDVRLWLEDAQLVDYWSLFVRATEAVRVPLEANHRAGHGLPRRPPGAGREGPVLLRSGLPRDPGDVAGRALTGGLPPGGRYYDFWTGASLEGGRTVEAPAPYEQMPLYVRAGFEVVFVDPVRPVGYGQGQGRTVTYEGRELVVRP